MGRRHGVWAAWGVLVVTTGVAASVETSSPSWLDLSREEAMLRDLRQPPALTEYNSRISRDPFFEKRALPPDLAAARFRLEGIQRVVHPVTYLGYVEMPGGRLLGQVNVDRKTQLVEPEAVVAGYTILAVTKEGLDVRAPDGSPVHLPYRTSVPSGAFEASVYDQRERATLRLRKGMNIGGLQVIDVTEHQVIVRDRGQTVILDEPGVGSP